MPNKTLADLALSISKQWQAPVFPCKADKSPACRNGFYDASSDPAVIRELFSKAGASLVGLPTGMVSGIVVIDLDLGSAGSPNGKTWYQDHRTRLPLTFCMKTRSGGRHIYFKAQQELRCSTSSLAPHVDVRGDGGYVVCAGPDYEVLTQAELSPLPDWLEAQLARTSKSVVSRKDAAAFGELFEFRSQGRWHDVVRDQVASMVARGVDVDVILDLAPFWTTDGYSHSQTQEQVLGFAESALAKGFLQRVKGAASEQSAFPLPPNFFEADTRHVPRFVLGNRSELLNLPKLEWLIKNVMPSRGLASVYGPSGSGKSFLLLDMAAAICLGRPWFGFKTRQSNVVYLCLEGGSGLQKRVLAWEQFHQRQFPKNFNYILGEFDLGNVSDVSDLAAILPKKVCLIIDTLNRAAPGRDENSSSDMSDLLAGAKRLEDSLEALVIVAHHTGKDRSKGLRGHSSLHAAMDAEIEVSVDRKLDTRHWVSSKLKDERDGQTHGFRLVPHRLGVDEDGDVETSCTVAPEERVFQRPEPTGSSQKPAYAAVKALCKSSQDRGMAGSSLYASCVKVEDAVTAIKTSLSTVEPNKRSNRAKKIISDLVAKGFLRTGVDARTDEGWIWLPED